MQNARLKYGICYGYVDEYGNIIKRKSLGIYGEGMVSRQRIENEIIPIIKEKKIDVPIIVYSYYSQRIPSKTGIDCIIGKGGIRFKPKRQRHDSKSDDWFVDEKRNIHRILEVTYHGKKITKSKNNENTKTYIFY